MIKHKKYLVLVVLALLVSLVFAFFGFWDYWLEIWSIPRTAEKEDGVLISQLRSLGYLAGYQQAPERVGVIVYDKELAFDGINIFCSGHGPLALLIDMDGTILHEWTYNINHLWEKYPHTQNSRYWRRVYLFENGDLLANYEYIGLIKLDKDSNLLWAHKGGEHHDVDVAVNGDIYVITHKEKITAGRKKGEPVIEDYITVLDSDGQVVKEYSIIDCFENSEYAYLLDKEFYSEWLEAWDPLHTNTVQVFDGSLAYRSSLFRSGNILISMRRINTIAIISSDGKKVVWAIDGSKNGMWRAQHEPILLENGNILIFDNRGLGNLSRILEFDPLTLDVFWQYEGNKVNKFYSKGLGANQRLPNGNTLITESMGGRVFEVTPDKQIVWEYVSPYRAGKYKQLIGTVFHMGRFDRHFIKWLQNTKS